jgi:hypothetical protein
MLATRAPARLPPHGDGPALMARPALTTAPAECARRPAHRGPSTEGSSTEANVQLWPGPDYGWNISPAIPKPNAMPPCPAGSTSTTITADTPPSAAACPQAASLICQGRTPKELWSVHSPAAAVLGLKQDLGKAKLKAH